MTTTLTAKNSRVPAWRVHGAARCLGLAAAPTFALMAWVAAGDAAGSALCSSAASMLPIDGMTLMYLLMSLFHLAPWLKLASGRRH